MGGRRAERSREGGPPCGCLPNSGGNSAKVACLELRAGLGQLGNGLLHRDCRPHRRISSSLTSHQMDSPIGCHQMAQSEKTG